MFFSFFFGWFLYSLTASSISCSDVNLIMCMHFWVSIACSSSAHRLLPPLPVHVFTCAFSHRVIYIQNDWVWSAASVVSRSLTALVGLVPLASLHACCNLVHSVWDQAQTHLSPDNLLFNFCCYLLQLVKIVFFCVHPLYLWGSPF